MLLVLYTVLQSYCIQQLSINYDEGSFAAYGTSLLKFQRQKDVIEFESKLPITALNMLPRAAEQLVHPGLTRSWPQSTVDIINGRYVSLLFLLLLGLLIATWTKRLYGEQVALFVLLTYLLCPNFLAYGIFVSSDIFACFFITAALYYLWLFFKEQKRKPFILMCIATGLAEISKFSMVHLFLLLPLLFMLQVFYQKRSTNQRAAITFKKIAGYAILFLLINWLIICSAHFFYQVLAPISQYSFLSDSFRQLQKLAMGVFPGFPVPLPSSYIGSMDAVVYFNKLGGGAPGSLNGAPYMLGSHRSSGFWYYYFVAMFFKVPVSLLLFWAGSIACFILHLSKKRLFQTDIFLLLPVLYFLVYMNFFYATQVGIRHILIIFPFLFILSGEIIRVLLTGWKRWILALLLPYQAVSVSFYFPHFLPYTNEFIPDKKMVYKKLADTNLCYGEGKRFLQAYLSRHPDAVYMPGKPVAGRVIVEVNEMLNLNIATMHRYDWAAALTPVDHIHSQYLVYDISHRTADSLQKKHR